jgi:hypothetical protein
LKGFFEMSNSNLTNFDGDRQDGIEDAFHGGLPEGVVSRPDGCNGDASRADDNSGADPFDPAALRLSQDFGSSIGVRRVLTNVPCRKPNRHDFVRVRPGDGWRLETGVFEDKGNRDVYLVAPALWPELLGEVVPVCLFLAVNRQGDPFLWPCKLPGADGRSNTWNESALEAARLAESRWIRVAANMPAGMYDVYEAAGELSEPTWPDLTFRQILKLSFKDRFIQSANHPVIRALRGFE